MDRPGGVFSTVVSAADFPEQLKALDATLRNIENVLDVDKLRRDKAELEEQASAPDLWDDQTNATRVTGRLSSLQGEVDRVTELDWWGSTKVGPVTVHFVPAQHWSRRGLRCGREIP